jgi:transcriptional regulator with XRE-family HTH domain
LGDHIRKRRLDLGLLQREVAEKLRVRPSTVQNWEGNATTPNYHRLKAIVQFLGYDPLPSTKTLGEQLVRYRQFRGLSQKQMASNLRVDPSTLARWERGDRKPTGLYAKSVRKVLRALGS